MPMGKNRVQELVSIHVGDVCQAWVEELWNQLRADLDGDLKGYLETTGDVDDDPALERKVRSALKKEVLVRFNRAFNDLMKSFK